MDWLRLPEPAVFLRLLPVAALVVLAFCFGRTLCGGAVPLIQRIALVSEPEMPDALRRYTRLLTGLWVAWFSGAALLTLLIEVPVALSFGWVWLGTGILFVGEHRLRPYLFPNRAFPGLFQQVRDTLSVWRGDERKQR